jgi:sortase A
VSSPILRGVDREVLDVAVGQIPGPSDFHERGNVGLAGHRDTHFRGLRNVRAGDRITIETADGDLAYEVLWTKVTTPDDVAVISPQDDDVLTLVTCFPFHYVGSAPYRFIVRAARR